MKILYFIVALIFIIGCKKPKEEIIDDEPIKVENEGVLICNEGNFNWGNASLSWIDLVDGSISNNVYKAINSSSIGDVCQHASYINNDLYVVINNSGKIVVLDKMDFSLKATISGLISPRYIQKVNNSKAYVTDLYSNSISILDLEDNSVTGNIPTNGWTEEMVQLGDSVYVAGVESGFIYIVNSNTNSLVDSIQVGKGVSSLQTDFNNHLWVLSGGDVSSSTFGYLKKIDIKDNSIVKNIVFNSDDSPSKLVINKTGDRLYFLNSGVYKFDVSSNDLASTLIIKSNDGQVFYGLGIAPESGNVFVSDAKDYVQNSTIFSYSSNGELLNQFESGVISGYFLFE